MSSETSSTSSGGEVEATVISPNAEYPADKRRDPS